MLLAPLLGSSWALVSRRLFFFLFPIPEGVWTCLDVLGHSPLGRPCGKAD